jgi:adenosine deaminase CECR1
MGDVQDYFSRRAALIQEDKHLRRENNLLQSLTENELAADKLVRRIRAEEAASIWGVEHDEPPHLFPGMEFLICMPSVLDYTCYSLLARSKTHNRADENLQNHIPGMRFSATVAHL